METEEKITGLGDVVAGIIKSTGLVKKPCPKCQKRREMLNKKFSFDGFRKNSKVLQGKSGGAEAASGLPEEVPKEPRTGEEKG